MKTAMFFGLILVFAAPAFGGSDAAGGESALAKTSGNGGNGDNSRGSNGGSGGKAPKPQTGPTWGEYGMMAGGAAGGIFALAQGAGFMETALFAAGGAIALGLPLSLVDTCRYAFREFSRAKRDSKSRE